jgi:hypothetical protein
MISGTLKAELATMEPIISNPFLRVLVVAKAVRPATHKVVDPSATEWMINGTREIEPLESIPHRERPKWRPFGESISQATAPVEAALQWNDEDEDE